MPKTAFIARLLPEPGVEPLIDAGILIDQWERSTAPTRNELVAHLADKDALLCMLTERIDAEVMDAAPSLKVIANLAVGFDNIDLEAAEERKIVVTNTPDVLTEATADLTFALLLGAARRLCEGEHLVRSGQWTGWAPNQLLGQSVWGSVLGIIGAGRIGTAVARRGRGFGMTIKYFSRSGNPAFEAEFDAERIGLDELLEVSDFVSLHTPLTADTHRMIGAHALERMKSTAVLVNTARGRLVDELALIDALRSGSIAAAALDVFEDEPLLAPGLSELSNVVLTPHIGSATAEARGAMVRICCDNIIAVLSGRPAHTPVRR